MMMRSAASAWCIGGLSLAVCGWGAGLVAAEDLLQVSPEASRAELSAYFTHETEQLEADCLTEIQSAEDWAAHQARYRRELLEMLGLWPLPERSSLEPQITGELQADGFRVQRLLFQSLPGLFVTANLYLPDGLAQPAPAILYTCGHGEMRHNGVSIGNKTYYQHHGAWFARHGYICLMLDTLQLGEVEGVHHGTYRFGRWWWNSRGYTPAGVEAWNAIRALDYLQSRPEVDATKLGMTGRSGGGSYTWTTAAIDDRIRAAAPVAGITDLRDQVIHNCVDGHCDCMFYVNKYRWDFAQCAALIAPRPLLIVNTDADPIFPLEGVQRIHHHLHRIYQLLGGPTNLGLVIGPGDHADTQDLQIPVLRWFDQHLRSSPRIISIAAEPAFKPEQLAVLDDRAVVGSARNDRIDQEFVPFGSQQSLSPEALREEVFRGWPAESTASHLQKVVETTRDGARIQRFDLQTQPHVTVPVLVATPADSSSIVRLRIRVLNPDQWAALPLVLALAGTSQAADPLQCELIQDLVRVKEDREAVAWLAPRGVGTWAQDPDAEDTKKIRRRFLLLGQTLDSMRVWDLRQAIRRLPLRFAVDDPAVSLMARGNAALNAWLAAQFEPNVRQLELTALPETIEQWPDHLNLLRVWAPQEIETLLKQASAK